MRAGRRRTARADAAADYLAACRARVDLGGNFQVYAVVERVHLLTGVHPEQRQQDRAGRDPDRTGFRGCVSVGSADGGLPARLAAGCDLLFAVRRLLRVVADRGCEGISGATGSRTPPER